MKPLNLVTKSILLGFSCMYLAAIPAQANTWENPLGYPSANKATLAPFASEKELEQWLAGKKSEYDAYVQNENRRYQAEVEDQNYSESFGVMHSMDAVQAAPPVPAAAMEMAAPADESVTNTQTAGVDEGGIVKVHGDHLVILRRGRLFTVDIHGKDLKPVSVIDAFAPGASVNGWYDEMLISGDTIIVISYSYALGGTELTLFNIDKRGELSYKSTHVLRSNDYYSSRNYASRLVGNKLVFYTPLYLNFHQNLVDSFPAVREWQQQSGASDFQQLAPATQIYRTSDDLDPVGGIALHTVQVCDLAVEPMKCTASGILGPAGREFYVSQDAVYIWTVPNNYDYRNHNANAQPVNSAVFRLPLDTSKAPTAIKTLGGPIDQFSFLESDGYLHVLLRAEGPSASMWSSEIGSNNLALLRVALSDFKDGTTSAAINNYHPLPQTAGGYSIQNRYVGDYLVYGSGVTWGRHSSDQQQAAYLLNWKHPQIQPAVLPVEHSVDRIEALGSNPLIVGSKDGDLYFSTIATQTVLPARVQSWGGVQRDEARVPSYIRATRASEYRLQGAAQGETRSHGFFYKPTDANNGILGLPFRSNGRHGWEQLRSASNGIIYVQNNHLKLNDMGILAASPSSNVNDNCRASCVDWYGNSRPLFVKGRIFALMGYELVEGKIVNQKMVEVQRIDFTPRNSTR